MKLKSILIMSLMSLFLSSCFGGKKPVRPLVKLSYSYGSQMMPIPSTYYAVEQDSTGIFATSFDRDANKYYRYKINDEQLMQKFTEVILEHKIYNYKDHYDNRNVLDGDHWGFHATFKDSTSSCDSYEQDHISTGGSNAGPKDDGLKVLSKIFGEAMQTATLLYRCDREGDKMPDVTPEVARGAHPEEVDFFGFSTNSENVHLNFFRYKESQLFAERFPGVELEKTYLYVIPQAPKCYGARLLDDGKHYIVCLIVSQGAVEILALDEVLKGNRDTSHRSLQTGCKDVCLQEGRICGINDDDQIIPLDFEPIVRK